MTKPPYEWEETHPAVGQALRKVEELLETGNYTPEQRRKQEWHIGHIRGIMQRSHNQKKVDGQQAPTPPESLRG